MKKSLGARTLVFPTPVWVVGSYDAYGRANAMTASWAGICCSKPPCVAVSLRKATYSYKNIVQRGAFTVSVPPESCAQQTDYLGLATGATADKFAAAGLTPKKAEFVDAPYIAEFPMVLECKVLHTLEIGLHTQFIGEILDVKCDEEVLGANGVPEMDKVKPFLFAPEGGLYYSVGACIGQAFSIGREF